MSLLDVYGDDELISLYELEHGDYDADLDLYEQFARRSDGPSLELGAGTGRVARHLVARGYSVVALDGNPRMLARLAASLDEETAGRLRLVEDDMRQFDLDETFELIYCALNTFEHLLGSGDQLAALRCVRGHLAPGGRFVMQVRALTSIDWSQDLDALALRWVRTDDDAGTVITKTSAMTKLPSQQQTRETIFYDITQADGAHRRRVVEVTLRVTGRFEVELLLAQAGMRISALYGDADLSPFDDDSDTMIVVAEREGT